MSNNRKELPLKLSDFPEVEVDGVKIYGISSMENQMAMLSQFLHGNSNLDNSNRREIICAILDFLKLKQEAVL